VSGLRALAGGGPGGGWGLPRTQAGSGRGWEDDDGDVCKNCEARAIREVVRMVFIMARDTGKSK